MTRDDIPDLILTNARVLTMDRHSPGAEAVAVKNGRIQRVGRSSDLRVLTSGKVKVIDCGRGTLMPGFHDAHMHLLAYAASLLAVDCRPSSVNSIRDIALRIGDRASHTPKGEWIRATGYDETSLRERRHPTRRDLDEATSLYPVRLDHRSGHASVLNTMALERVGIGDSFSEPPGATIERELDTGSPSGLLLEMQDYLENRTSAHSIKEIESSVQVASKILLAHGVTTVQDATHHNSVSRWDFISNLIKSAGDLPRVTLMPGYRHLPAFLERGLHFGSGGPRLRTGHVKIMVTASSGSSTPDKSELALMISECVESGFPVAIHAVEAEVVRSAAEVIAAAASDDVSSLHRIEHGSECPPDTLELVARSAAKVVTQPSFVYQNGDRYLSTVDSGMLPHLYRVGSFMERGIEVAFGSDAPFGGPDPMHGIFSAVERKTASGRVLAADESIGVLEALESYTAASARASGIASKVGTIMPGMYADMILFEGDITSASQE
ncbi:MAG: amidohydrolase family protein, partial [Dehalococcoidia bacterium]|nr:amidohydrolase family protein [Dehalococcoidia bacterium]